MYILHVHNKNIKPRNITDIDTQNKMRFSVIDLEPISYLLKKNVSIK